MDFFYFFLGGGMGNNRMQTDLRLKKSESYLMKMEYSDKLLICFPY